MAYFYAMACLCDMQRWGERNRVSVVVCFSSNAIAGTFVCKDPLLAKRAQKIYETVCKLYGSCRETFMIKISVINAQEIKEKFPLDKHFVGWYSESENIVYLAEGKITDGVLAHELAHASIVSVIICPLTDQMQEVLAGYAEYEMRKVK